MLTLKSLGSVSQWYFKENVYCVPQGMRPYYMRAALVCELHYKSVLQFVDFPDQDHTIQEEITRLRRM